MEIIHIILTSIGSILVLFIATKIMGNREISELNMFDYINGITIGSIAAEMAISLEDDFVKPLVAMLVYAVFILIVSILTNKSIIFHRLINGRAMVIYDNGMFFNKNMSKSKINIAEFLTECRDKGYFNIADIQTAIIEASGKITILPKSNKRNVTPEDLNLQVEEDKKVFNVIIDSKIMEENLKATGHNKNWLETEIKNQKIDIKNILLATCDNKNNISIYQKNQDNFKHDAFI